MGPKPNDGPRHFHGMTDHNCGQLGEFLKRFWGSWDSEAQKCVDCEAEILKKTEHLLPVAGFCSLFRRACLVDLRCETWLFETLRLCRRYVIRC